MIPSLPDENKLATSTYHHAPPITEPVILGVDEAGRGPVLGPMVYGVAYCPMSYRTRLGEVGFADSKALTAVVREQLIERMLVEDDLRDNIGWAVTVMTAADITEGMLRPRLPYNLNQQAHDTTIALIQRVVDAGVSIAEIYVDTVGPPEKYQEKLQKVFPFSKVTVTKKADSLFPIVSCASVCAKVTRDASLDDQLTDCGSGYPSDPNTGRWLKQNMDPVFGWGPLVRYSWSTARDLLDNAVAVEWPQDEPEPKPLKSLDFSYFASIV